MLDKRQNFTPAVKDAEFKAAKGRCRIADCKKPLNRMGPGAAQFHHIVPTAVGGTNELKNCLMLCPDCHARNTKTVDRPALDKTRRILKKNAARAAVAAKILTEHSPWGTTRRKAKIPSRPMGKSSRKIASRPFQNAFAFWKAKA